MKYLRDKHVLTLLVIVVSYVTVLTFYSIMRYYTFKTEAFDFGIFNQAFWSTLHGRLFYETPDQAIGITSGSFLGVHFAPFLFLLFPLYALFPHPETLFFVQTIFIAASVIPIYLIGTEMLGKNWKALAIACLYLFNPLMVSLNMADFHLEAFFPLFFALFYYFMLKKKWVYCGISWILSAITIDFASVMLLSTSLAYLLGDWRLLRNRANWRTKSLMVPTLLIFVSVAYFLVAIYLSGVFANVNHTVTVGGLVNGLFSFSPQDYSSKLVYWLEVLGLFAFLPVVYLSNIVMILPWIAVTVFGIPNFTWLGWQYGAFIIPPLMIGFITVLSKLKINIKPFLGIALVFVILISPFNPLTQNNLTGLAYQGFPIPDQHTQILQKAVSLIPDNASIYTQNSLFSQVSERFDAYVYLSNGIFPQFIFADTKDSSYQQPIAGEKMSSELPLFMANATYGMLVNDDGVILLEKGYKGGIILLGQSEYVYNYNELSLISGSATPYANSSTGQVLLHKSSDQNGTKFWSGPAVSLPPGEYNVTYKLMVSLGNRGNITVAVNDSINSTYSYNLANKTISAVSMSSDTWENVTLQFDLPYGNESVGSLEFSGTNVYGGNWYLDYIKVTYVGAPQ